MITIEQIADGCSRSPTHTCVLNNTSDLMAAYDFLDRGWVTIIDPKSCGYIHGRHNVAKMTDAGLRAIGGEHGS